MTVWMSSGAFEAKNVRDLLVDAKEFGINHIELSSGMDFFEGTEALVEESYSREELKFLVHNYFPAPEVPFVLNIGARDDYNRLRTIEMGKKSIELASRLEAPFYSIHGGFAAIINHEQLGKPSEQADTITAKDIDRLSANEVMVNVVRELADHAKSFNMDLLIENNVISPIYLEKMPINPLLLTEPEEILNFFEEVQRDNVGLLLDVAHAKVSSTALGFRAEDMMEAMGDIVKCLHLSDNDGRTDSNLPISTSSWFMPLLSDYRDVDMVIEAYNLDKDTMQSQLELLDRI